MLTIPHLLDMSRRHRSLTLLACVAAAGVAYGTYLAFGSTTPTKYVLGVVERGDVIARVSASGQVTAQDEIALKPKVSGDVVSLPVKAGTRVKKGTIIAAIDATDARQTLTNAQLDLEEARLSLARDTSQAPIDFKKTKDALADAQQSLIDEYDGVYTEISDAFVALPSIMAEADNLLDDSDLSLSAQNVNFYQNLFVSADDDSRRAIQTSAKRAVDDYESARSAYEAALSRFKALSRSSGTTDLESMLEETERTLRLASQALVSEVNLIDSVIDQIERRDWTSPAGITTQQSSAHAKLTEVNSLLTAVSARSQALRDAKKDVTTAEQDLAIESIGNPDGTNPFDLQLARNEVQKKEAALRAAEAALADHLIRAPFDGIVASIDVKLYDGVSSATSIATLISDAKMATLSLNEVDATAVAVGDEASLTFDALDDLRMKGSVAEIDTKGTVSQGVVSYDVRIALEGDASRIKPGMTVSAEIVTDSRTDVLLVPTSAVKTNVRGAYVMILTERYDDPSRDGVESDVEPQQIAVEIGIADDEHVEIVSGLSEGDQIVVRTSNGAQTTQQTNFRGPGGGIRL